MLVFLLRHCRWRRRWLVSILQWRSYRVPYLFFFCRCKIFVTTIPLDLCPCCRLQVRHPYFVGGPFSGSFFFSGFRDRCFPGFGGRRTLLFNNRRRRFFGLLYLFLGMNSGACQHCSGKQPGGVFDHNIGFFRKMRGSSFSIKKFSPYAPPPCRALFQRQYSPACPGPRRFRHTGL